MTEYGGQTAIIRAHTGEKGAGATAAFPFDRATIDRFRKAFPRARWRDDLHAWFVPGTTAERRLNRWLGRELGAVSLYDDERGRDAFAFDPIESPYLTAGDELEVRTPYSRTVLALLRDIPWARWEPEQKCWHVPFRSVDEVRRRWTAIEAAARRAEPEERRRRWDAAKGSAAQLESAARAQEKRQQRHPLPPGALPPFGGIVMTREHGAIIFTDITGELVEADVRERFYSDVAPREPVLIWGEWRRPTLSDLIETWPARHPPTDEDRARGWWQPTLDDLRHERKKARSIERAQETRRAKARPVT
ncbi:MAG TPA: hypothetical protein VH722_08475 [Alphaproteobacteria bacterium]|jgi:hypothetical protein|nr:hypothetical protein [Alphaproteobacteria bacterium]